MLLCTDVLLRTVSKPTLFFTVPPEPPVLYTARATSSSLVFHWRLSSNGDAPITGYTMTYHAHPRGPYKQVTIPRHTTSYYLNVSATAPSSDRTPRRPTDVQNTVSAAAGAIPSTDLLCRITTGNRNVFSSLDVRPSFPVVPAAELFTASGVVGRHPCR